MKIFYFTATGNSLYVAKRIGGELYSIPQMLKQGKHEFEDAAIGFVFPCYGFGLPRIVIDFLQKSQFEAKYFFAIMTYGNQAASGLRHLEEVGSKAGIQFNYTNEILMIDNYLPFFKIETQLEKESSKKIEEKLDQIVSNIQGRQKKLTTKGIASVVFSKLIHNLFSKHQYDAGDKQFIVRDNCTNCKICGKVCPKNNIRVGIKPEFLHKCDGCYACIHHCPQNAIHLKSERSNARFINRNVKLQEIIDANNQHISGVELSNTSNKIRAIITGTTGMVGEGVLHECLIHPDVEQVLVVNRRPCGVSHPKLIEKLHSDFFDLSPLEPQFKNYNACFFCLGVSSVGMKEAEYNRLTYDLTIYVASLLSRLNPQMVFCYVSGNGTDSTAQGRSMWARIKGKTENHLLQLPFKRAYMFRPGYIHPTKGLKKTHKFYFVLSWLYPVLKRFLPNHTVSMRELGVAMIHTVNTSYNRSILENTDIVKLAKL